MQGKKVPTRQLGLVLTLDEATSQRAIELCTQHKKGNVVDLGGRHMPHVTLYHSKLGHVLEAVVDRFLGDLAAMLPINVSFTEIETFGGKFLFWDTERSEQLVMAHEVALGLSKFFIPSGVQQADKEKIFLSPGENLNVQKFGHPLVGKLWRPHVTLGYFSQGISVKRRLEKFKGRSVGVAFVRVGEAGTVAEVIRCRYI